MIGKEFILFARITGDESTKSTINYPYWETMRVNVRDEYV